YDPIDTFVDEWLGKSSMNHILVLGDYGTGKTWFCRHYAHKQLQRYKKNPSNERLPILINLRDYTKHVDMKSMMLNWLDNHHVRMTGGYRAFEELALSGKLVLILDGFDEMSQKANYNTVVKNFWETTKLIVPGNKIILSSRISYFHDAYEVERLFEGKESEQGLLTSLSPKFEILQLEPFSESKLRNAVKKRVPKQANEAIKKIQSKYDLGDLVRRPVLLSIVLENLMHLSEWDIVSEATLYEVYTNAWINRAIEEKRTFLNAEDKNFFMEELAWEMFQEGILTIHYTEFPNRILEKFGFVERLHIDYFDYDLRSQSFLTRTVDGFYSFIHKSFMEFFSARKLYKAIKNDDFDILQGTRLSHEISLFGRHYLKIDDIPSLLMKMAQSEDITVRFNLVHLINVAYWGREFDRLPLLNTVKHILVEERDPGLITQLLGIASWCNKEEGAELMAQHVRNLEIDASLARETTEAYLGYYGDVDKTCQSLLRHIVSERYLYCRALDLFILGEVGNQAVLEKLVKIQEALQSEGMASYLERTKQKIRSRNQDKK
ncbi:MAG: NACHT domain-containing protein, partial [Saprospiraceae bacterium]